MSTEPVPSRETTPEKLPFWLRDQMPLLIGFHPVIAAGMFVSLANWQGGDIANILMPVAGLFVLAFLAFWAVVLVWAIRRKAPVPNNIKAPMIWACVLIAAFLPIGGIMLVSWLVG